eukprot:Skav210082  [mRNA]  locus=scaffold1510:33103:37618:- [translate_table: standard]
MNTNACSYARLQAPPQRAPPAHRDASSGSTETPLALKPTMERSAACAKREARGELNEAEAGEGWLLRKRPNARQGHRLSEPQLVQPALAGFLLHGTGYPERMPPISTGERPPLEAASSWSRCASIAVALENELRRVRRHHKVSPGGAAGDQVMGMVARHHKAPQGIEG